VQKVQPTNPQPDQPNAPAVFKESFQNDKSHGLDVLSGNWSIVNEALHVDPGADFDIVATQEADFTDYEFGAKVNAVQGYTSAGVVVRWQDSMHHYVVTFDSFAESIHA